MTTSCVYMYTHHAQGRDDARGGRLAARVGSMYVCSEFMSSWGGGVCIACCAAARRAGTPLEKRGAFYPCERSGARMLLPHVGAHYAACTRVKAYCCPFSHPSMNTRCDVVFMYVHISMCTCRRRGAPRFFIAQRPIRAPITNNVRM